MPGYWLGHYVWSNTPAPGCWTLPTGATSSIDLAAPESLPAPGAPRLGGVFVTPDGINLGSDYVALGQGARAQDVTGITGVMRSAFQSQVGHRPAGTNLALMLAECLTTGSDPTGLTRCKPVVPTRALDMNVWLGGVQFNTGKFRWGTHPHTAKLRDLLQRNFKQTFLATQSGQAPDPLLYRKVLGGLCQRYGLSMTDPTQWREFVPTELRGDVAPPVRPTTTLTDNFNRADSTSVGTASGGGVWAEYYGSQFQIVSNKLEAVSAVGDFILLRLDSDLSSDDHECQATMDSQGGGGSNIQCGPKCRKDSSTTQTYYAARYIFAGSTNEHRLIKAVGGSLTDLGTNAQDHADGEVLLVRCDGSDISLYRNGSLLIGPITDSAITGHTRCGVYSFIAVGDLVRVEDWSATDLGGGAQTISPTGVASTLAFGTLKANPTIFPGSRASTLALGSPQLNPTIYPASRGSGLVIGSPSIVSGDTISPGSVASTLAFGTLSLNPTIFPASRVSSLQVGTVLLVATIFPASRGSTLTIGSPSLALVISPASRASTLAIGSPQLNLTIYPASKTSGVTFGVLSIFDPNNILVLEPPFTVVTTEAVLTVTTPEGDRTVTTPVIIRSVFTPPRG